MKVRYECDCGHEFPAYEFNAPDVARHEHMNSHQFCPRCGAIYKLDITIETVVKWE